MRSPAEIINTRTAFLGVSTAEIEAATPKLDKRIRELSALTPADAQRYASTMYSSDQIEGALIREAKAQQRNRRTDHLKLALDTLRLCLEMRAHLDTDEAREAAQREDGKRAADRARRESLPAIAADPFARADDAAEYYGGGSID
jgi:hypothetical protein